MASEIEFISYTDFVEGLSTTENPGITDKAVVSNSTDGPRVVPANTSALSNVATVSDVVAGNTVELQTNEGKKKLDAETLLKATAQNSVDSVQYQVTADTLSQLGDADTFPANSQVRCLNTSIAQQVSHIPVSAQFVCYTFLSGEGYPAMQLFICSTVNEVYFRRKWTTWGTWERLAFASEAENLADRFSAYKNYAFGAVAVKDGHYLRAIENIVAGAFNPEQWESSNTEKSHQYSVNAETLSVLGDADIFPANSQVRCFNTSIAQQVGHIPVSDQFVCYTFLSGEGTPAMQLFICKSANEVYFRRKWTTWGTWERLAFASEAENLADRFSAYKNYAFGSVVVKDGHYLRALKNIVAGAFNHEQWESSNTEKSHQYSVNAETLSVLGDADTFPANSQVRCLNTSIAQQVSHIPVSTQFVCYTFLSGEGTPAMQLFIINNANEVYFRRKWSTWGTWEKLAFASEAGDDGVNVLGAFDNIVAIGDSLTYSQVYTGESAKRQAKHTWAEILANYCGADYQVIAQPGYTAANAWTLVNAELVQKTNGIAIIYLGTNDGLTETLDTDAPSNLPYTEWASTNTGCFAKIIAKAQSIGYKVMLLKPWSTSGSGDSSLEHTNATIDSAGSRFGCAVVEPFRASDIKYHYYPDLSGSNNVHYNDLGYAWFATKLISEVTKLGNDNMKFIIPS